MEFLLALQFLTRIPVTIRRQVQEVHVARAMAYFPLVGLLIGLLSGGLYAFLQIYLPTAICDLLVITFLLMITGNMHLDGLMDTADGIFSGKPRERMLEIMKDSRVGAHGLAAGVIVLLGRFILLNGLSPDAKVAAIITAPVFGRWIQVYSAWKYPYARIGAGTGSFTKHLGSREVYIATLTVLIVFVLLSAGFILANPDIFSDMAVLFHKMAYMIICWVLMFLSIQYMTKKLGGLTGDTYGALSELTELLFLMFFLVR